MTNTPQHVTGKRQTPNYVAYLEALVCALLDERNDWGREIDGMDFGNTTVVQYSPLLARRYINDLRWEDQMHPVEDMSDRHVVKARLAS